MLTIAVSRPGLEQWVIRIPQAAEEETTSEGDAGEEDLGPNPIAPEVKELAWGAGAFIVLALAMRFFLFPRLKRGMDARYGKIRGDLEEADAAKDSAQRDVAEYEAQLAAVKAEAARRIDVARAQLENERQAKLLEVTERIAARRSAAMADADAAKAAARGQVEIAAGDVAASVVEMAIGRRPDPAAVAAAVSDGARAGVAR